MRKILLLTLIISFLSVNARHISPEDAYSAALEFFGTGSSPKKASGVNLKLEIADPMASSSDWQPYYVFKNEGENGFVIISGDDCTVKVLGYSDKGSFDPTNMPPQLKELLEQFAKGLNSVPKSSSTDSSWTAMPTRSEDQGVLLETANWGQGYPYNSLTPMVDGQHTLTGCVATAMAIVMKYHNWPETGEGSHSYDWMGSNIGFDYRTHFDWSNTPDSCNENPSPEEMMNVAKLMSACGIAVDMDYGLSESGAYTAPISIALSEHFGYSLLSQFIEKKHYTDDDWESILKYELSLDRPLIYSSIGSFGKHAFVCDGFKDSYFHINWGWDGNYNGYYALTNLNPYDPADDADGFNKDAIALIGITPDKSAKRIEKSPLCIYPVGLASTSSELYNGEEFELIASDVFNINSSEFIGKIAAVQVNKEGELLNVISQQDITIEPDGTRQVIFKNCKLSSISNGDMVTIVSRSIDEDDWHYILR